MKTMMKILVLLSLTLSARAQNVVVVQMDRVFVEYFKTREAEIGLQEQIQEYREQQQKSQEDYQALQQQFNQIREAAAQMTLTDEARRVKAGEASELLNQIRAKEEEIRGQEQQRQQQIEEKGRRMRQRLVEEILEKIREMAPARNWDLVLDSAGASPNGLPNVLFAQNSRDVTAEVIQALNRDAQR
jgi:outer membrane protein